MDAFHIKYVYWEVWLYSIRIRLFITNEFLSEKGWMMVFLVLFDCARTLHTAITSFTVQNLEPYSSQSPGTQAPSLRWARYSPTHPTALRSTTARTLPAQHLRATPDLPPPALLPWSVVQMGVDFQHWVFESVIPFHTLREQKAKI